MVPESPSAKSIASAPGLALASRIAWRSEPMPESARFRTVKVLGKARPSSSSRRGTKRRRDVRGSRLLDVANQVDNMRGPPRSAGQWLDIVPARRPSAGAVSDRWARSQGEEALYGLPASPGGEPDGVGHAVAVAVEGNDRDGPEGRLLEGRADQGLQRPGVGEGDPHEQQAPLLHLPADQGGDDGPRRRGRGELEGADVGDAAAAEAALVGVRGEAGGQAAVDRGAAG